MASAGKFVDLHVHTWHSDSTLSPSMAVAEAVRNGVGVFAVADHEGFDGIGEAARACAEAGVRLIPAAELELTDAGTQYHLLCYGADSANPRLRAVAAKNRFILDRMSEVLIERLSAGHPALSMADYGAYQYDRGRGGWKGLSYLLDRGVTETLRDGMRLYAQYGVDYERAGFPGLDEVLGAIHGAGGRAVLAHAGHTLSSLGEDGVVRRVEALFERGIDGVECHYPLHSPALTARLAALCRARGGMITAGSDCHGAFGHTRVGEMNVTLDQIDLRGL